MDTEESTNRKSMCWVRDEWSYGCIYAVYKCRHLPAAVSQFKGIPAPRCPGKCEDGCVEVWVFLIAAVIFVVWWAVVFVAKEHVAIWAHIR